MLSNHHMWGAGIVVGTKCRRSSGVNVERTTNSQIRSHGHVRCPSLGGGDDRKVGQEPTRTRHCSRGVSAKPPRSREGAQTTMIREPGDLPHVLRPLSPSRIEEMVAKPHESDKLLLMNDPWPTSVRSGLCSWCLPRSFSGKTCQ
jgi:hypothetical protein